MTPEKLSEWKKLAEAATEGPWYADITRSGPGAAVCRSESVSTVAYPSMEICKFPHKDLSAAKTIAGRAANFDFIAAARTAVPELIAEVERLQRELKDRPYPDFVEFLNEQ